MISWATPSWQGQSQKGSFLPTALLASGLPQERPQDSLQSDVYFNMQWCGESLCGNLRTPEHHRLSFIKVPPKIGYELITNSHLYLSYISSSWKLSLFQDVKKSAETIRYNHPLRKCVDTILTKCPESVQETVRRSTREDYQDYNNPTETPTEKSLVRLHKNVIKAMQAYRWWILYLLVKWH